MQPTSKSSSLFSKRSTSMVRASVFVDPQPTQADDPQSIFTTTSHQSNHESTNKQALAPIGVRRAFGEITNHRQQQQPDSIFQSMNKKPPLSNNNLNWNQPILPQNKPQQEEKPPALASSSCRFHEPKFDPFSTEIDSPFGVGQTTTTTGPFGQGTIITQSQQHVSHHVCVSHLPVGTDVCGLIETLQTFGAISHIYAEYLQTNRFLTVSYYDLRHAMQAMDTLKALGEHSHVQVDYYSDSKLSFLYDVGDDDTSTEAATVIVTMLSSDTRDHIMNAFDYKSFFQRWGDIRTSLPVGSFADRMIVQVEFYDTRAAERIISQVHEQVYQGIIFHVSHPSSRAQSSNLGFVNQLQHIRTNNNLDNTISDNVSQQQEHLTYPFGPSLLYSQQQRHNEIMDQSSHDAMIQSSSHSFSLFANNSQVSRLGFLPTSSAIAPPLCDKRNYQVLEDRSLTVSQGVEEMMEEVVPAAISERRPSVATRSSSVSSLRATTTSPEHNNLVDLQRIIDGSDTRTTFMIRNIPNKYTQQMLKESIDATHYGTYDFLYLRIDFQNKCNVGYAFINFIDVKSVVSFAQERVGKRWSRFNSEKRCSLSYANIQGKEALVEKFRNSTVMDEPPSYRPMLFYSSGPHKGEQQPFPEPTISAETRYQRRQRTSGSQRQEKK